MRQRSSQRPAGPGPGRSSWKMPASPGCRSSIPCWRGWGLMRSWPRACPGLTRCGTATATVIGVLVRNLALGREPLYALAGWAAGYDEALLGLGPQAGGDAQ